MSRAYQIELKECVEKVIRAEDRVSTALEILEILPPEAMADLLRAELLERGYVDRGDGALKKGSETQPGVEIAVDPATGEVTVSLSESRRETIEATAKGWGDTDHRVESEKRAREQLGKELRGKLEEAEERQTRALQRDVSDRLEGALADVRRELDRVVNRVTAEALKRKAASLGTIKEMSEDPEAGSLTIVLEV